MAFDLSSITSLFKKSEGEPASGESFLGIDIGSSAIKVVQLKSERGVPTLETYGELQLGPYENTEIGRATNLPASKQVEALIDILRESGATGKRAALAYSANASFTHEITIPTLEQSEIASTIPVEARKYIPASLTKVTLDWIVLGADEEKKETSVLLSAIYNESISRYKSLMAEAQLKEIVSEIELFSTVRAVVAPQDTSVAVLDMGASSTRLYIVEHGLVRKTHTVPLSGPDINHALEKALEIDFLRAEETKRLHGMSHDAPDERVTKTLTEAVERGLRELHTVITRYEQIQGTSIDKIILSGGGALLKGVDGCIKDIFSKKTERANPFNKVAYPAFLEDTLKEAGPSFAVAVGVALRAFQDTTST